MAKLPTVSTITSANNNIATLNANFSALRDAFEAFLSRDGETPNTMTADIDLNSNDLLNAQDVKTQRLFIANALVNSVGNLANWQGAWATTTDYDPYDIVYEETNNALYRCIEEHTSGTFSTDLSAGRWEMYFDIDLAQETVNITGGTIAGITDLAIADGGTGASDEATARSNLGLELGVDVQEYSALLQDIADATFSAGDILYYDGTDLVNLGIGSAGEYLKVNSAGNAPEWTSTTESLIIAVSDETTQLTTGAAKVTFRMPYAFTVSEVRASVATAPTGSAIEVDINEGGVSILSTVLSIDDGEKTSETAATPAVISDASLADDAEITIDIDQVGSTTGGAGLKVTLIGSPS